MWGPTYWGQTYWGKTYWPPGIPEDAQDAGKDTGTGRRPWWEDLENPVEPLVQEIEKAKAEVRELRSEPVPKDDIAPLIAKLGGVTRSVRALEKRVEKANTEFEANQAVEYARTIAERVAAIEVQVREVRLQARRDRLRREDEEIISILAEIL